MENSPFFCEEPPNTSTGVGAAYGVPYRFGFFPESVASGETSNMYYRLMVGDPSNKDRSIEEVSCVIKKSLFNDDDEEEEGSISIIKIFKYKGGPIVIFQKEDILGIIKDRGRGDSLWGNNLSSYAETIDATLDAEKINRETYIIENVHEERVLLYTLKIDISEDNLLFLEKEENPFYSKKIKSYLPYTLLLDSGSLFITTPKQFTVMDQRIKGGLASSNETEGFEEAEGGLMSDPDTPITLTSQQLECEGIDDLNITSVNSLTYNEEKEPEILFGEYNVVTLADGCVVEDYELAKSTVQSSRGYLDTNLITKLSESGSQFTMSAAISITEDTGTEDETITVEVGDYSELIGDSDSKVVVPLCSVLKINETYSLSVLNDFSATIGGNGLLLRNEVGELRESDEEVKKGEGVVVDIEVGEDGLIRAVTATLSDDESDEEDPNDGGCNEDDPSFPSDIDDNEGPGGGGSGSAFGDEDEDDESFPSENDPCP